MYVLGEPNVFGFAPRRYLTFYVITSAMPSTETEAAHHPSRYLCHSKSKLDQDQQIILLIAMRNYISKEEDRPQLTMMEPASSASFDGDDVNTDCLKVPRQ
jgi:hypothetical protein